MQYFNMTKQIELGKEYGNLLREIKSRVISARIQVARAASKGLIQLYWDIGKSIVECQKKHEWGDSVVSILANDLKKIFPGMQGFSERNVWSMRRFYEEYHQNLFLQQLVAEIPWGHNLLIMSLSRNAVLR